MAFFKMATIMKNGVAGKQLRHDIEQGIEQLDQGRARALDLDTIDRIKRAGRKQLAVARGKARRR
jgi:hypothetical protein